MLLAVLQCGEKIQDKEELELNRSTLRENVEIHTTRDVVGLTWEAIKAGDVYTLIICNVNRRLLSVRKYLQLLEVFKLHDDKQSKL